MKNRLRFLLLIFCFCCSSIQAQIDSSMYKLSGFVKNINSFSQLLPQEKVYLHFDNTGYYLGETIWFKAYIVTAGQNISTELSKVLYVELLNPEGDIVETKKLKIENGQCNSNFVLKDSLFSGYYEVRAYTSYMLNFGNIEYWSKSEYSSNSSCTNINEYENANYRCIDCSRNNGADFYINACQKKCIENVCIFSRVFTVYNRPIKEGDYLEKVLLERPRMEDEPIEKDIKQESIKLNFYPEGGNLITGLTSKIAFKAVNEQGEDIEVSGSVYNADGEKVVNIETLHQGMGYFNINVDGGKYTAQVYYKDKTYKFDLPNCISGGYAMSVNNLLSDNLFIQVQKSIDIPAEVLGLTISCRGKVSYFDTLRVASQSPVVIKIPKSILSTGVNQITLFDEKGEIVAERLAFMNHQEYKDVSIKSTNYKTVYQPYERIDLNFQLHDSIGSSGASAFSLSVRDAETDDLTYNTENIISNLLLSSDLKGYIADPAYYFLSEDKAHQSALDLLLMTQGWRRYSWKQMAGLEPFDIKHPTEKGIAIDGIVLSIGRKKVANAEVKLRLISSDSVSFYGECITDKNAKFSSYVGDMQEWGDLTIKVLEKKKGKNILNENYFPLDRNFSPVPKYPYSFYEINIPYSQMTSQDNKFSPSTIDPKPTMKGQYINEVTVKAKQTKRKTLNYNRPNFRFDVGEEMDKVIDDFVNDDLYNSGIHLISISCIRRGINNVSVIFIENDGLRHNRFYSNNDLSDIDSIFLFTDIATRNRYASLSNTSVKHLPEVLVLYRYLKSDKKRIFEKGTRHTKFQGYSYIKEFYSPNYEQVALPDKKDFRRTLYWNPDVKTDSTGNASVSFYNNSTCKRIKISAETLSEDGLPGVYEDK